MANFKEVQQRPNNQIVDFLSKYYFGAVKTKNNEDSDAGLDDQQMADLIANRLGLSASVESGTFQMTIVPNSLVAQVLYNIGFDYSYYAWVENDPDDVPVIGDVRFINGPIPLTKNVGGWNVAKENFLYVHDTVTVTKIIGTGLGSDSDGGITVQATANDNPSPAISDFAATDGTDPYSQIHIDWSDVPATVDGATLQHDLVAVALDLTTIISVLASNVSADTDISGFVAGTYRLRLKTYVASDPIRYVLSNLQTKTIASPAIETTDFAASVSADDLTVTITTWDYTADVDGWYVDFFGTATLAYNDQRWLIAEPSSVEAPDFGAYPDARVLVRKGTQVSSGYAYPLTLTETAVGGPIFSFQTLTKVITESGAYRYPYVVRRANDTSGTDQVTVQTAANQVSGDGVPYQHFVPVNKVFTFAPGETLKTGYMQSLYDCMEKDGYAYVNHRLQLTDPSSGTISPSQGSMNFRINGTHGQHSEGTLDVVWCHYVGNLLGAGPPSHLTPVTSAVLLAGAADETLEESAVNAQFASNAITITGNASKKTLHNLWVENAHLDGISLRNGTCTVGELDAYACYFKDVGATLERVGSPSAGDYGFGVGTYNCGVTTIKAYDMLIVRSGSWSIYNQGSGITPHFWWNSNIDCHGEHPFQISYTTQTPIDALGSKARCVNPGPVQATDVFSSYESNNANEEALLTFIENVGEENSGGLLVENHNTGKNAGRFGWRFALIKDSGAFCGLLYGGCQQVTMKNIKAFGSKAYSDAWTGTTADGDDYVKHGGRGGFGINDLNNAGLAAIWGGSEFADIEVFVLDPQTLTNYRDRANRLSIATTPTGFNSTEIASQPQWSDLSNGDAGFRALNYLAPIRQPYNINQLTGNDFADRPANKADVLWVVGGSDGSPVGDGILEFDTSNGKARWAGHGQEFGDWVTITTAGGGWYQLESKLAGVVTSHLLVAIKNPAALPTSGGILRDDDIGITNWTVYDHVQYGKNAMGLRDVIVSGTFTFTDLSDQTASATITSDIVTYAGADDTLTLSGDTSAEININGGGWVDAATLKGTPGTTDAITAGDTIQMRVDASSTAGASVNVTLTVDGTGYTDTWTVGTSNAANIETFTPDFADSQYGPFQSGNYYPDGVTGMTFTQYSGYARWSKSSATGRQGRYQTGVDLPAGTWRLCFTARCGAAATPQYWIQFQGVTGNPYENYYLTQDWADYETGIEVVSAGTTNVTVNFSLGYATGAGAYGEFKNMYWKKVA